jgi:hypothetical protein
LRTPGRYLNDNHALGLGDDVDDLERLDGGDIPLDRKDSEQWGDAVGDCAPVPHFPDDHAPAAELKRSPTPEAAPAEVAANDSADAQSGRGGPKSKSVRPRKRGAEPKAAAVKEGSAAGAKQPRKRGKNSVPQTPQTPMTPHTPMTPLDQGGLLDPQQDPPPLPPTQQQYYTVQQQIQQQQQQQQLLQQQQQRKLLMQQQQQQQLRQQQQQQQQRLQQHGGSFSQQMNAQQPVRKRLTLQEHGAISVSLSPCLSLSLPLPPSPSLTW